MIIILSAFLLGLAASQTVCPPPIDCPPREECGPDMMYCENHQVSHQPTSNCPLCPGQCPPQPPCPTGTCVPMQVAGGGPNNPDGKCPNFCPPPPCPEGSVQCPPDYDPSGCQMPPTCSPQPMCGEPLQCPQSNGPDGCPLQPKCGPDSMLCAPPMPAPTAAGPPACPPLGWCEPMKRPGPNGQMCYNTCPTNCPDGMAPCPADHGPDGCPMAPMCVENPSPENCPRTHAPNGCRIVTDPQCMATDKQCPVGVDRNGCHLGFVCHAMDSTCPPPTLPPPNY